VTLYRVFPWDTNAADDEYGGALFAPPTNTGRIDNPDVYGTLYLASHPEAPVAETLGRLRVWRHPSFFRGGLQLALAAYELADDTPVADLASVAVLSKLGVQRAPDVVSRDRESTQALARTVYDTGRYAGISWWSYYLSDWTCVGLWDHASLRLKAGPIRLDENDPAVGIAADTLPRQLFRSTRKKKRKTDVSALQ